MKTKAILGGLILALAGLGLIFLGCGGAKQAEPYVVGGIFSISGPASYLGEPERNSLEMVVEAVNAQGGINGHPVKLAIYDDEGDVTKARLHATKLAQDKDCLAVIGPSLTHTSMTTLEITQKAKLPLISCAAGSAITAPAKDRVWVLRPPKPTRWQWNASTSICKSTTSSRWPSSRCPPASGWRARSNSWARPPSTASRWWPRRSLAKKTRT